MNIPLLFMTGFLNTLALLPAAFQFSWNSIHLRVRRKQIFFSASLFYRVLRDDNQGNIEQLEFIINDLKERKILEEV